jgi:hypothetical protein
MHLIKIFSIAAIPLIATLLVMSYHKAAGSALDKTVKQTPAYYHTIAGSTLDKIVKQTPAFNHYIIQIDNLSAAPPITLTSLGIRPANLFLQALLAPLCGNQSASTLPDEGLFQFNLEHDQIADFIEKEASSSKSISFSFKNFPSKIAIGNRGYATALDIFGRREYQISYQEVQEILKSQRIYVSKWLPLDFYIGLKQAMKSANLITLPGTDSYPFRLRELKEAQTFPIISEYLAQVAVNPSKYGFNSLEDFNHLLELTIYQIGSMVVKSEDYRLFIDEKGKILERHIGTKDSIRLLSACGIRAITSVKTKAEVNHSIMVEAFKTALVAAEDGMVLFPAVGMGVWGGNPDLYWRAFLEAVIASNGSFDAIFVNPGHGPTPSRWGKEFAGKRGEEFATFLASYKMKYANDSSTFEKLNKIQDLHGLKTDLMQLAYRLKKAFPDKTVSLFNASNPDVTLGYHVGEYVNSISIGNSTEENYTAMGSNGLCFETITRVHEDPKRLFQVSEVDGHK